MLHASDVSHDGFAYDPDVLTPSVIPKPLNVVGLLVMPDHATLVAVVAVVAVVALDALPDRFAVIVPAEKLPDASRNTNVLPTLLDVSTYCGLVASTNRTPLFCCCRNTNAIA